MTGRFAPQIGLRVGQTLPVILALDHFHLFDPKTGVAIRGLGSEPKFADRPV